MRILKSLFIALTIFGFGCNTADSDRQISADSTVEKNKSTQVKKDTLTLKTYSNERFKDVAVTRITEDSISISGKAQVFEAVFNWTMNDENKEIKSGYQTTSAGAPEWGNFRFRVKTAQQNSKSSLHLVLFEASAKDGSKTFELVIPIQ